jgi:peptidoglycan/LPS O-acetylase OafA/YrhL
MQKSKSYRSDIDGLRGFAVFSVVAYHAGLPFFSGGFVGVDIFFVISGYLICAIIHREIEAGDFSFARFYARRVRRILPALFAVLLFCYVMALLILNSAEMKDFSRSAVANLTGTSNIYFWRSINYFSPSAELKPLMMTWSLSVEEQFYLFFPVILLLVNRFRLPLLWTIGIFTAASFFASLWVTQHYPSVAFFLLPTRAWELGAGALLAIHESRRHSRILAAESLNNLLGLAGVLLLVLPVFFYDTGTVFPGLAVALPVLGATFAIAANGSLLNRVVLSNRAIVFIGLISYSWYLWHWPLLSFARLVSDHPPSSFVLLSLAALSFVLAVLSWRFVEQPFRRTTHGTYRTLWRYATAAFCMIAIGMLLVVGRGWPQRFTPLYARLEDSTEIHYDPCLAAYGEASPILSKDCVAATTQPGLVLIGDSHASALAPALRALADNNHFAYSQYTKSSCPTLTGVTRFMPAQPGHDRECAAFNEAVLDRVSADPHVHLVVFAGYWSAPFDDELHGQRYILVKQTADTTSPADSRRNLETGMRDTVQRLSAAGKRVVIVKDVPMFDFDPVRSAATDSIPTRRQIGLLLAASTSDDGLSVTPAHVRNGHDVSEAFIDTLASGNAAVTVLDPRNAFCSGGRCRFRGPDNLYYIDFQHVSPAGAQLALNNFDVRGAMGK